MVYYSVLKDIIEKPKTKDELINAILQKIKSIVTEYGIDYVMKHNKDHYFDVDNNEIIVLDMKLIVDNNAANPYDVSYRDKALYNYTKKRFNFISENSDGKECGIRDLTIEVLKEINDGICDCTENVRKDKKLLSAVTELLPIGTFFRETSDDDAEYFRYVTGEPYLSRRGIVSVPSIRFRSFQAHDYKTGADIGIRRYDGWGKLECDIKNVKCIQTLTKDKLVENIFSHVKTDDCTPQYYSKNIDLCNMDVEHYTHVIEESNEKLKSAKSKTKILELQLSIAQAEENIEKANANIKRYKKEQKNIDKKITDLKNTIIKLIDNLNFDNNDNE